MSIKYSNYFNNLKDFTGFNDLRKFNINCENDYRKLITSVLKLLKSINQFGGSGNNNISLNKLYPRINSVSKVILPSINNHLLNSKSNSRDPSKVILPSINNLLNSGSNNRSQKSTVKLSYSNISTENSSKNTHNQNSSIYQCKVFAYLNKKSKEFVDNSTCFSKCVKFTETGKIKVGYKENCLLSITLDKLIELTKNKNLLKNTIKIILEQIFQKIHQLHLLGVAHNNLNCINVVVIREANNIDIRFINFSKATILQSEEQINKDDLEKTFNYYSNYLRSVNFFQH